MEDSPEIAEAERLGDPFLVWKDSHGREQVLSLRDGWGRVTIGRGPSADVGLPWDTDVSRVHAELVKIGDDWAVVDDGISTNGTFVGDERVERRRRLHDGDVLRCGSTELRFRAPFEAIDRTNVANPKPPPGTEVPKSGDRKALRRRAGADPPI
ncbi:MAG: FHA domain-containing protein [Solirubrobacterales bacterium]